jgi:hypothetical protein
VPTECDPSELLAALRSAGEAQIERAVLGMDRFTAYVLSQAIELAPIKFGDLKASGYAEDAVWDGSMLFATLGFGVYYAAAVHERLDVHHDQGQAKFVEVPIRQNAPRMAPYVAGYVSGRAG